MRASNWPNLAIIDDPNAPESLRWVHDDADFRVVRARMISTNENLTERVADLLPWLVPFIQDAPYSSRETTDLHILAFNLKTGVRG